LSMAHETSLRYSIMNYLIQNPGESYTVSSDGCMFVTDSMGDVARGALVGTVQVNLPRIAYESAWKDERFLQGVTNAVDEAVRALEIRGQAIHEGGGGGGGAGGGGGGGGGGCYGSHPMAEISLLGLNEAVKHHIKKDVDNKD